MVTGRGWNWPALVAIALLAGIVFYVVIPGTIVGRIIVSSIAAVFAGAIFPGTFRRSMERRVRQVVRKSHGDHPQPFSVELRPDCLWTRSGGMQLAFDWSVVERIEDASRSIDFIVRPAGIVTVRKRAFHDEAAMHAFLARARSCREEAEGRGTPMAGDEAAIVSGSGGTSAEEPGGNVAADPRESGGPARGVSRDVR